MEKGAKESRGGRLAWVRGACGQPDKGSSMGEVHSLPTSQAASLRTSTTQPSTHLNRTSAGKPNTGSMLASSHRLVSGSPGYPLPKAVVSWGGGTGRLTPDCVTAAA